jgi:TP901 family phage tail tape measure protein
LGIKNTISLIVDGSFMNLLGSAKAMRSEIEQMLIAIDRRMNTIDSKMKENAQRSKYLMGESGPLGKAYGGSDDPSHIGATKRRDAAVERVTKAVRGLAKEKTELNAIHTLFSQTLTTVDALDRAIDESAGSSEHLHAVLVKFRDILMHRGVGDMRLLDPSLFASAGEAARGFYTQIKNLKDVDFSKFKIVGDTIRESGRQALSVTEILQLLANRALTIGVRGTVGGKQLENALIADEGAANRLKEAFNQLNNVIETLNVTGVLDNRQVDAFLNKLDSDAIPSLEQRRDIEKVLMALDMKRTKQKQSLAAAEAELSASGKRATETQVKAARQHSVALKQTEERIDALRQAIGKKTIAEEESDHASRAFQKRQRNFNDMMEIAIGKIIRYRIAWVSLHKAAQSFTDSIKLSRDFEYELAQIAKVTAPVSGAVERLTEVAKEFSGVFGASLVDTTKVMKIWAQQGKSASEIADLTRTTLVASATANLDTQQAVEALTSSMKQFNISAKETMDVIEKLLVVQAKHAVTSQDLADAIKLIGTTAKTVGYDLDELLGAVTAVAVVTRKSGKATANSLKTIFARITKKEAISQLQQLGVATKDSEGNMRALGLILGDLDTIWGRLTQAQKLNLALTIGGVRRYSDFLVLMDNYGEALAASSEAASSSGMTQRALALELDTTSKKIEIVTAKLNKMLVDFAKFGSLPILERLLSLGEALTSLPKGVAKTIGQMTKWGILLTAIYTGMTLLKIASRVFMKQLFKMQFGMAGVGAQTAFASMSIRKQFNVLTQNTAAARFFILALGKMEMEQRASAAEIALTNKQLERQFGLYMAGAKGQKAFSLGTKGLIFKMGAWGLALGAVTFLFDMLIKAIGKAPDYMKNLDDALEKTTLSHLKSSKVLYQVEKRNTALLKTITTLAEAEQNLLKKNADVENTRAVLVTSIDRYNKAQNDSVLSLSAYNSELTRTIDLEKRAAQERLGNARISLDMAKKSTRVQMDNLARQIKNLEGFQSAAGGVLDRYQKDLEGKGLEEIGKRLELEASTSAMKAECFARTPFFLFGCPSQHSSLDRQTSSFESRTTRREAIRRYFNDFKKEYDAAVDKYNKDRSEDEKLLRLNISDRDIESVIDDYSDAFDKNNWQAARKALLDGLQFLFSGAQTEVVKNLGEIKETFRSLADELGLEAKRIADSRSVDISGEEFSKMREKYASSASVSVALLEDQLDHIDRLRESYDELGLTYDANQRKISAYTSVVEELNNKELDAKRNILVFRETLAAAARDRDGAVADALSGTEKLYHLMNMVAVKKMSVAMSEGELLAWPGFQKLTNAQIEQEKAKIESMEQEMLNISKLLRGTLDSDEFGRVMAEVFGEGTAGYKNIMESVRKVTTDLTEAGLAQTISTIIQVRNELAKYKDRIKEIVEEQEKLKRVDDYFSSLGRITAGVSRAAQEKVGLFGESRITQHEEEIGLIRRQAALEIASIQKKHGAESIYAKLVSATLYLKMKQEVKEKEILYTLASKNKEIKKELDQLSSVLDRRKAESDLMKDIASASARTVADEARIQNKALAQRREALRQDAAARISIAQRELAGNETQLGEAVDEIMKELSKGLREADAEALKIGASSVSAYLKAWYEAINSVASSIGNIFSTLPSSIEGRLNAITQNSDEIVDKEREIAELEAQIVAEDRPGEVAKINKQLEYQKKLLGRLKEEEKDLHSIWNGIKQQVGDVVKGLSDYYNKSLTNELNNQIGGLLEGYLGPGNSFVSEIAQIREASFGDVAKIVKDLGDNAENYKDIFEAHVRDIGDTLESWMASTSNLDSVGQYGGYSKEDLVKMVSSANAGDSMTDLLSDIKVNTGDQVAATEDGTKTTNKTSGDVKKALSIGLNFIGQTVGASLGYALGSTPSAAKAGSSMGSLAGSIIGLKTGGPVGAMIGGLLGSFAGGGLSSIFSKRKDPLKEPLEEATSAIQSNTQALFSVKTSLVDLRDQLFNAPSGFILPASAKIPSVAVGGHVSRSGIAEVHKGETIVPAGSAAPSINITFNGPVSKQNMDDMFAEFERHGLTDKKVSNQMNLDSGSRKRFL